MLTEANSFKLSILRSYKFLKLYPSTIFEISRICEVYAQLRPYLELIIVHKYFVVCGSTSDNERKNYFLLVRKGIALPRTIPY